MKNWSNKQHEEVLQQKRDKILNRRLESFNRAAVPTTVYLDNYEGEVSTVTVDGVQIQYIKTNGGPCL